MIFQPRHMPTGNTFDSGRLSPIDVAKSLAIWKDFIAKQLLLMRSHGHAIFSTISRKQIICFLDRRSVNFEFVIRNASVMLGHDWGFQLVTTPENARWAENQTKGVQGLKVLPLIAQGNRVNTLKRSVKFWKLLHGESFLVIDADSIFCHGGVTEYLEYDYVAALWRKEDISPWCSYGGGISLRKKSVMIKICREYNKNFHLVPDESILLSMMLRLQVEDYHLPADSVAASFAVERCYNSHPFALHKAWLFMHHEQLSEILGNVTVPGLK